MIPHPIAVLWPPNAANLKVWLLFGGLLCMVVLVRAVPAFGRVVSAISWAALLGLLVLVVAERERFDPTLGRIATRLGLDDQEVVGNEVRLKMGPDGHFWARVTVGGVERRMLVDSGATVTALSAKTAEAAGLDLHDSLVPVMLKTANGTAVARSATVDELRVGDIVAKNLGVVVSPGFGDLDVLGMNFLSRLKSWRVEDNVLILEPHYPQPDDADAGNAAG